MENTLENKVKEEGKEYKVLLVEDIFLNESYLNYWKTEKLVSEGKLKEMDPFDEKFLQGEEKDKRDLIKRECNFNLIDEIKSQTKYNIDLELYTNVDDAYEAINQKTYDLVITDLGLPVKDISKSKIFENHKSELLRKVKNFKTSSEGNDLHKGSLKSFLENYKKFSEGSNNSFDDDILKNIGASLMSESLKKFPTYAFTNDSHKHDATSLCEVMGILKTEDLEQIYSNKNNSYEKPVRFGNFYVGPKLELEDFAYVINDAIETELINKK